jgi:hypothetical protein
MKYIGQTGRTFTSKTQFKEHIQDIRANKQSSKYPQHILDAARTFGTTDNTLKIPHVRKKGPFMNILEKFHIYNPDKEYK